MTLIEGQYVDSFQELMEQTRKSPEYAAYKRRMELGGALTGWLKRIPYIGELASTFWFCLLTEGPYQTMKPRWGALTFSFLNDGMKPTLWHTWRQMTHDNMDKYAGIYPGGAPNSLKQAQEWDLHPRVVLDYDQSQDPVA